MENRKHHLLTPKCFYSIVEDLPKEEQVSLNLIKDDEYYFNMIAVKLEESEELLIELNAIEIEVKRNKELLQIFGGVR